tara:strand:- start:2345 stop:2833 length:489 start_codon:yes stop_codon:yes gene_type:complete
MASSIERWHQVQQFLFQEAQLMDERRWDDWLALYTDDSEYWMPYEWGQQSATDHVSLFFEDKTLLRMRIDRLKNDLSPLEWPPARTNRHLSNVQISGDTGDRVTATAYLAFVEYRREEQRWFSSRVTWDLRAHDESFRIAAKRVDLLNCDQESGHLRFAAPM